MDRRCETCIHFYTDKLYTVCLYSQNTTGPEDTCGLHEFTLDYLVKPGEIVVINTQEIK